MVFFFGYGSMLRSCHPGYESDERSSLGERGDRCRWQIKEAERVAAVYIFKAPPCAAENIGHRNRAIQQCRKGIVHQEKATAAGGRCSAGTLNAAVEKIEEKRKPDDFFGHRKRDRTNWMQIQRSGAKPTRVLPPQP